MDIRWLEDFITLADTRNFSRAAVERHVTQPAFSRRIRALEAWVGAELVDRSTYPTALTAAGRLFRDQAADTLRQLHDARGVLRGRQRGAPDMLTVAAGHTLAVTFYARWMASLQNSLGPISSRLVATNVHDAVLALVESGCDLLLCYSHSQFPLELDLTRHASMLVGRDVLVPVSIPGPGGAPVHDLKSRRARPVHLVAYSPTSYLGRVTDPVLHGMSKTSSLKFQCITDRSEAVKAMVLEGFGTGWIPKSMIAKDLAEGRLVLAGAERLCVDLQIRIFRSLENRKLMVNRVWDLLNQMTPPGLGARAHDAVDTPAKRSATQSRTRPRPA